MSLTPGPLLGPYRITAPIGAGGMGEVYRAEDTSLGRDVAIKVLPDAFAHDGERLARFDREARTLAFLNHPNIAVIYGIERSAGNTALVMELVEGETLADRLRRGPLAIDEAIGLAIQIGQALEAAHQQGVIHRDLKPANIKVRPDGRAKVLDFGLAKITGGSDARAAFTAASLNETSAPVTATGVVVGTPAYMSPEQASGEQVDARTDVWAFGCVLYEMLTGRRAFSGTTSQETFAAVLTGSPGWSALSAAVVSPIRVLLRRCLARDRRERIPNMGIVLFVLEERHRLAAESTDAARGGETATWQGRILWSGSVMLLAGLAAPGSWMWFSRSRPPTDVVRTVIAADTYIVGTDRTYALTPDGSASLISAAMLDRSSFARSARSIPAPSSRPRRPFAGCSHRPMAGGWASSRTTSLEKDPLHRRLACDRRADGWTLAGCGVGIERNDRVRDGLGRHRSATNQCRWGTGNGADAARPSAW